MNGREYHFVSREEMEGDIHDSKLLEYGESRGHLYGVSTKSVKRVIDNIRIPVLDLHPQVSCELMCTCVNIIDYRH